MIVVIVDGYGPPAVSFLVSAEAGDGTGSTTRTFSSLTFGSIGSDRRVVAGITWLALSAQTLDVATIGGVSATIHKQHSVTTGSGSVGAAIISAPLPTGASGDVACEWSGGVFRCGCDLFRLTGWAGLVVTDDDDTGDIDMSLDIPAYSSVVGVVNAIDTLADAPTATATWTGITERSDVSYGPSDIQYHTSASDNFGSEQSLAISCVHGATDAGRRVGVAVGFYNN